MAAWNFLLLVIGALGGRMTNLWGGFISCLAYAGVVIGLWRKFTCQGKWWCWRHPHHALEGTPYHLCAHHHPDDQENVHDAIKSYRLRKHHRV